MFQGGGNIPVLMPVLSNLVERGHDVRIMAGPGVRWSKLPLSQGFLDRIKASGATLVPFREPDTHPLDDYGPIKGVIGKWSPADFKSLPGEARTGDWAPIWATNMAEELRNSPADLVIADFALRGALVAAEAANIPSVALSHTVFIRPLSGVPPYGPGWRPAKGPLGYIRNALGHALINYLHRRDGLTTINHARARLGLAPIKSPFEQYDRAARVLMLIDWSFDFPAKKLPKNMRYVGTPIEDAGAVPWTSPWPVSDQRPLVLVSLSTTNQGQTSLLKRILLAVSEINDARILVTLGPALDQSQFEAPSNVKIERFVPHSAVLPHAAVMVSQCGIGAVTKALQCGVPLLCVPILGDQPDNAARIVARGAGIRIDIDAQADEIRTAIEQLLREPAFRNAAASMRKNMQGQDPVSAAVAEIEAILAESCRSSHQIN